MSRRAEAMATQKDALLMQSALCRLRLHRDAMGLRNSLSWRRALSRNATTTGARVAFGVALALVGLARGARVIALAGRVVLIARAAQAAIGLVRQAGSPGPHP